MPFDILIMTGMYNFKAQINFANETDAELTVIFMWEGKRRQKRFSIPPILKVNFLCTQPCEMLILWLDYSFLTTTDKCYLIFASFLLYLAFVLFIAYLFFWTNPWMLHLSVSIVTVISTIAGICVWNYYMYFFDEHVVTISLISAEYRILVYRRRTFIHALLKRLCQHDVKLQIRSHAPLTIIR